MRSWLRNACESMIQAHTNAARVQESVVDDQYDTLPVRDRRRSSASAEDVMPEGSRQKSFCTL